jgi:RNA polymerase sigma-70 factor (ECF subfamily)
MSTQLPVGDEGSKGDGPLQFKFFFDENYETYYRIACRILNDDHFAHDITSQAFIKVWEKGFQVLEDKEYAKNFLKRCLINLCIDHLRKEDTYRTDYPKDIPYEEVEEEADRIMIRHDIITVFQPLIEELPEMQKLVIKKLYLDEMTAKEVAEEMGLSIQSVYTHKYLALKKLDREAPSGARRLLRYLLFLPMLFPN